MTDDAQRWADLKDELSRPGPLSHIYDNTDVLPPEEEPTWRLTYEGERIFSEDYRSFEEIDDDPDAVFSAHHDEDGNRLGYIATRRAK